MSSDAVAGKRIAAPAAGLEVWKAHLAALAAIFIVLGTVFFPDIHAATIVWWYYPAYSHCFLIIPISAWLIWEKRDSLAADTPAAMPLALLGAIPFVALWFVGRFGSITEFRQFALVGLMEVSILAILGRGIFTRISFACLYLFFLVPTGQYLIPPLQALTAKFVELGLNLFAIPYYRDGLVFELVNGRYEIAEACAGLRFLIATVALGALFAHMMYRKPAKIALFMVACFGLPLVGNGLRALFTVTVANYTNNRVAAGIDHILYGWMFAVAIIFTLMYVGARFRDPDADAPPAPGRLRPAHYPTLLATFAGALAILSAGPATAWYADRQPSGASQAVLERAFMAPGWHADSGPSDWQITFFPGTAETKARLARDGATPVDINLHYYARKRGTGSLLAANNHSWNVNEWHPIAGYVSQRQRIGGLDVPFDEAVISTNSARRLVWTSYWIDGRFATSSLAVRLLEFRSGITHGHSAVLVLSTPITSTEADARARIAALLASLPSLPADLNKAGDAPAQTR